MKMASWTCAETLATFFKEAHSELFLFYRSFLWARTDQPALKSQVFLQKPATGWGTIVRLNEPYL